MKVLVGTYRQANYKWIREHKLYNLPWNENLGIDFYQSFAYIVLINGKNRVLSAPAKFKEVVSSAQLEEIGYKGSGRQNKKYALYELQDESYHEPVLSNSESDIYARLKKINSFLLIYHILQPGDTVIGGDKVTNFTFAVNGPVTEDLIDTFNDTKKFKKKFEILAAGRCSIVFDRIENQEFSNNLRMIDGNLPEICACLLQKYYIHGISSVTDALEDLERENPLGYDTSCGQEFYHYKFKVLLYASALGMQPSKVWNGEDEATGGYIIVKEDGQVLCYHVYNRNEFIQYLLQNTKFDTPSTGRHDFGKIYEKDGKYYVKLNLQVRFIK